MVLGGLVGCCKNEWTKLEACGSVLKEWTTEVKDESRLNAVVGFWLKKEEKGRKCLDDGGEHFNTVLPLLVSPLLFQRLRVKEAVFGRCGPPGNYTTPSSMDANPGGRISVEVVPGWICCPSKLRWTRLPLAASGRDSNCSSACALTVRSSVLNCAGLSPVHW